MGPAKSRARLCGRPGSSDPLADLAGLTISGTSRLHPASGSGSTVAGRARPTLQYCTHDGLDGPPLPVLPPPALAPRSALYRDGDDRGPHSWAARPAARILAGGASGRAP